MPNQSTGVEDRRHLWRASTIGVLFGLGSLGTGLLLAPRGARTAVMVAFLACAPLWMGFVAAVREPRRSALVGLDRVRSRREPAMRVSMGLGFVVAGALGFASPYVESLVLGGIGGLLVGMAILHLILGYRRLSRQG